MAEGFLSLRKWATDPAGAGGRGHAGRHPPQPEPCCTDPRGAASALGRAAAPSPGQRRTPAAGPRCQPEAAPGAPTRRTLQILRPPRRQLSTPWDPGRGLRQSAAGEPPPQREPPQPTSAPRPTAIVRLPLLGRMLSPGNTEARNWPTDGQGF